MAGPPLVLLFEPDETRRAALREAFEAARLRVAFLSGPEAAARAGLVAPQLVVVSLLTDPPAGISLVALFRDDRDRASVPVLVVHDPSQESLAEEALAAGADDALPWPVSAARLRSRVRSLAGASAARAEGEAFLGVLARVVAVGEAREPHRSGHSERVARLSACLAEEAGFSGPEIERLRRGALLHDLGFAALPDALLLRERPLTRDEEAQVRTHPVVGAALLADVPSFESLRVFVHRHHERVDGSGYPDGLRGAEIPVAVQLLSLADAWDGITSWRPHRPRRTEEEALELLHAETLAGTWDEALVALLPAALAGAAGIRPPR